MENVTYKGVNYTFDKILGKGTYGTTWLATENTEIPRKVAIKIFDYPDKESVAEDLSIELAALTSLLPVCTPYSICIQNWNLGKYGAIVMDYVNGEPLNKLISGLKKPLIERQEDDTLLNNLIKGIKYIHSVGIAHQDIKDENIMWDYDADMFRFIDFGLSCVKIKDSVEKTRKNWPCGTIGTFYTASPDIAILHKKNAKLEWDQLLSHDYWSIGIVLLRWYTFPGNYYYYRGVIRDFYNDGTAVGINKFNKWSNILLARSNFAPVYYDFPRDLLNSEIDKIPSPYAREVVRNLLIDDWVIRFNTFNKL